MNEVTCEFCGKNEMTFGEYTQHVKDEHADIMNEPKINCERCDIKDYKSVMNGFGETGDKHYYCDNCKSDMLDKWQ